jgi:hypothetical protein
VALGFAAVATVFAVLTIKSQKFIEYLVPLGVVGLALAVQAVARRPLHARLAALACLGLGLVTTGTVGSETVARMGKVIDAYPPPIASEMQALVPVGAQVFTCGWGETGVLFNALPERRFMVALDPSLFWSKDPALYRRWVELVQRPPRDVARIIRRTFDAQWAFCVHDPDLAPFFSAMENDPHAQVALRTRIFSLYRLSGAAP